ncbi:putative uncharacterized protein DDB_G0290521 [Onychostoma macrolepis]|uniref:putative uncharacterized protein DDB_G0290521 n=1 Tax=Onychostoma macrolepis TaxID=369639 RepID=UPI00272B1712|nr:putative uncharacterized protein DDB_G0290521 [Onychostoma macrolepis]
MFTCLPSMAPMQFGKFHLDQNFPAMTFHMSSVGFGNCIANIWLSIVLQVVCTLPETVLVPRRYCRARLEKLSPVPRNLTKTKRQTEKKKYTVIKMHVFSPTVNECKRRWKVLRDAFARNRKQKNLPSGSAGGSSREWKYEQVMSFLLPHMQARSSRHTLQLEDVPVDMSIAEDDVELELAELSRPSSPVPPQQRSANPTPSTILRSDTSTPPPASQRSNTPTPHPRVQALISETQTTRQKKRRSNDPTATEQQLLEILTQPTTTPAPYIPKKGDEMYYFALSLVPKLARLCPRNQTKAQVYILTYLSDLEEEEQNMQQSHTTTQPFTSSQQPHSSGFHQYHPTLPCHQSHTQQLHTHHLAQSTPSSTRSGQQHSSSMEDPSSPVYHHF